MTTAFVLAAPRIVVGLLLAGHGLQKLAGWFGGPGLQGTADFLGSLRISAASLWHREHTAMIRTPDGFPPKPADGACARAWSVAAGLPP